MIVLIQETVDVAVDMGIHCGRLHRAIGCGLYVVEGFETSEIMMEKQGMLVVDRHHLIELLMLDVVHIEGVRLKGLKRNVSR